MIARFALVILGYWSFSSSFAQTGYIATDTSYISGIELIPGPARDNALFIKVKSNNGETIYSPQEIKEYGFENGKVYVSQEVFPDNPGKRVFLEKIEEGKITLYLYSGKKQKSFFLKSDSSTLIKISRKKSEYRKLLLEQTRGFAWKGQQPQLVTYRKQSLAKLISQYNAGKHRPLNFAHLGIRAGYVMSSYKISPKLYELSSPVFDQRLRDIRNGRSSNFLLGAFGEIPIGKNDFSLLIETNYMKGGFSTFSRTTVYDYFIEEFKTFDVDMVVKLSTIQIPLLLRYTLPKLKWRPFVNVGGNFAYHFKNSSRVYQSDITSDVIMMRLPTKENHMSIYTFAYNIGAGLQYNLNYRNMMSAELRYNNQIPTGNAYIVDNQLNLLINFTF
ncbi:MAG: outer membrane beta-barrel protein [Cyclobacteriaceae bacterium]